MTEREVFKRAEYLISKGYVTDMTFDELVEHLKIQEMIASKTKEK